jgi:GAF domain-containing protein
MNPRTSSTDAVEDIDRLIELSSYDVSSPEVRTALDEFAHTAAERLGMPIGLVTIVLDSAMYFAGRFGLSGWLNEADGTPVEWSFCASAVRSGQPYVVEDASIDEVQADNPLVVCDGVRSYAGAPLKTANGQVLGACCVVGVTPHHFEPGEIGVLEELAAQVIAILEQHKL